MFFWSYQRQAIQLFSTLLFSFTVIFYDRLLLFSSNIGFYNVSFPFPQPLAEQKQLESCIGFSTAIVREGYAPKLVLCSVEASV